MMFSAVLAIGGRDFFLFIPQIAKFMMIKPVSGKVLKYEMIGFKFIFHNFFYNAKGPKWLPWL